MPTYSLTTTKEYQLTHAEVDLIKKLIDEGRKIIAVQFVKTQYGFPLIESVRLVEQVVK